MESVGKRSKHSSVTTILFKPRVRLRQERPLEVSRDEKAPLELKRPEEGEEAREGKGDGGEEQQRKAEEL